MNFACFKLTLAGVAMIKLTYQYIISEYLSITNNFLGNDYMRCILVITIFFFLLVLIISNSVE